MSLIINITYIELIYINRDKVQNSNTIQSMALFIRKEVAFGEVVT